MLYIGRVVNTHGIKGEVRIVSDFKYKKEIFQKGNHLYINDDNLVINSYRVHKNFDMVTFEGINSIDDVLKYKGQDVYIDRNEYIFPGIINEDLIGVNVYGDGELLGTVSAIEQNFKQELIVVENGKKHYLIPYVEQFIKSISKERIDINIIEGLLDENWYINDISKYVWRIFKDPHRRVDDYGFGGGQGMVLMPQPIFDAVDDIKTPDSKVILMTPQGVPYKQAMAYDLAKEKHLILVCGHYEGFDERIRTLADMEISIGDYVLTGGEIPSMVITDSVVRLIDGVIEKESHLQDSFNDNLLDYPVYTKPVNFRGMEVPDVLLSGHYENIRKFRESESIKKTKERRPDLLEKRWFYEQILHLW